MNLAKIVQGYNWHRWVNQLILNSSSKNVISIYDTFDSNFEIKICLRCFSTRGATISFQSAADEVQPSRPQTFHL